MVLFAYHDAVLLADAPSPTLTDCPSAAVMYDSAVTLSRLACKGTYIFTTQSAVMSTVHTPPAPQI